MKFSVLLLIDRKQWHKIYFDKYFTVWVFVCIIPAWLLFLWWMSQWEIFFCIFWQKREWVNCFRFSSTYFFFAAFSLSVGLASLTIFLLFISLSVSWIDSSGMLGSIEKLILIIFSNQRISSEDNSVPEEQFESLLQRNHALVHLSDSRGQAPSYSQLISRYCRPSETSRVCCSSFPPSNSPAA